MTGGGALPDARTTRLLPFGVLLDQAMAWTRRYLKAFVLPYGTVLAVLNALVAVVQAGWMQSLSGMATGPAGEGEAEPSALLALGGCVVPLLAVGVVAVTWFLYSAMCAAATDAVAGRETSASKAARFVLALPRLGTLLLAGLLTGLSYLCCLVPILYVGPMLSLLVPAMTEEGLVGGAAISRSVQLTHHNPRKRFLSNPLVKAFVLFIVTLLISVLLSLATSLPIQIAQQWMTFREAGAVEGTGLPPVWVFWIQVPAAVVSAYLSTAAWLYGSFGLALLYFDTRKRREGMDLEEAMAELDHQRLAGSPT